MLLFYVWKLFLKFCTEVKIRLTKEYKLKRCKAEEPCVIFVFIFLFLILFVFFSGSWHVVSLVILQERHNAESQRMIFLILWDPSLSGWTMLLKSRSQLNIGTTSEDHWFFISFPVLYLLQQILYSYHASAMTAQE